LARGCEPQKWGWQKKTLRLFGEEFHTLSHIFLCIENVNGLQVQNGHTKFSVAFSKLVGIVPILACQNPSYKTLSIPKLWSWHIPLFDIITMLFGCFMGLLMVFTDFNSFWIEYDKWGHFIMSSVGPFHISQELTIWFKLYDLQISPKCINVLRPWTLIECGGCNEEYFYVFVDTQLESTTTSIGQVCWMLVVVQDFFHVGGWNFVWFAFRLGESCYARMVTIVEHYH
jgi:hypothetical protein